MENPNGKTKNGEVKVVHVGETDKKPTSNKHIWQYLAIMIVAVCFIVVVMSSLYFAQLFGQSDKSTTTTTTVPIPTMVHITTVPISTPVTIPTTVSIPTTKAQPITTSKATPANLLLRVKREEPMFPIYFIEGPFTFKQAIDACKNLNLQLAMKDDINKAFDEGFYRCNYGWLGDMHTAIIRPLRDTAIKGCKSENVGAIYTPAREPMDEYAGAYCVKETKPRPSASALGTGSNPTKTVNWWVANDPAEAYNLHKSLSSVTSTGEMKYPLMTSLKSVYTCCNMFNVTYENGSNPTTYVKLRKSISFQHEVIEAFRRQFETIDVYAHVHASYEAMMIYGAATSNKNQIISDLVDGARSAGLNGLVYDYEPHEDYSIEHVTTYRNFLEDLSIALRHYNMSLGTVISGWGILKYYDIFNSTSADFFGTMSSTYYGDDIEGNKERALETMKHINMDRLEFGLGSMHMSEFVEDPKRDYKWQETDLEEFVTWLDDNGAEGIHVYPGHWRSHTTIEPYFLQTLSKFSEN